MCRDCWELYSDQPLDWSDDIPTACQLIDMLYADEAGIVGGPLHVFLDDWNVDSDPEPYEIETFSPVVRGLTLAIVEIMTPMSPRQRAEVLRQQNGYHSNQ